MGDLISISPIEGPVGAVSTGRTGVEEVVGTAPEADISSDGPIYVLPRLSLILKSCRSISNSEMEFFFIRSMIALMSFKSTGSSSFGACRTFRCGVASLSKKAVSETRHCLSQSCYFAGESKEGTRVRQEVKV